MIVQMMIINNYQPFVGIDIHRMFHHQIQIIIEHDHVGHHHSMIDMIQMIGHLMDME
jgi:hypothetical protein